MSSEMGTYVIGYPNSLGSIFFGINPTNTFVNSYDKVTQFDLRIGVEVTDVLQCSAWGAGTSTTMFNSHFGHQSNVGVALSKSLLGTNLESRVRGSFTLESASDPNGRFAALGLNCLVKFGSLDKNTNVTTDPLGSTLPLNDPAHSTITNRASSGGSPIPSHTDLLIRPANIITELATSAVAIAGVDASGMDQGFTITLESLKANSKNESLMISFPMFVTAKVKGTIPPRLPELGPGASPMQTHCLLWLGTEQEFDPVKAVTVDADIFTFVMMDAIDSSTVDYAASMYIAPATSAFLFVPLSIDAKESSTLSIHCPDIEVTSGIIAKTSPTATEFVPVPTHQGALLQVAHRTVAGAPTQIPFKSVMLQFRTSNGAASAMIFATVAVVATSILAMFF